MPEFYEGYHVMKSSRLIFIMGKNDCSILYHVGSVHSVFPCESKLRSQSASDNRPESICR